MRYSRKKVNCATKEKNKKYWNFVWWLKLYYSSAITAVIWTEFKVIYKWIKSNLHNYRKDKLRKTLLLHAIKTHKVHKEIIQQIQTEIVGHTIEIHLHFNLFIAQDINLISKYRIRNSNVLSCKRTIKTVYFLFFLLFIHYWTVW